MKIIDSYILIIRTVRKSIFCRFWQWWVLALATFTVIIGISIFFLSPPANFIPGSIVRIERGTSVPNIVNNLSQARIISHPTLLRLILRISGESKNVKTGTYEFKTPQNMLTVMYRVITGDYGLPPVKITFIEGTTVRENAIIIAKSSLEISESSFTKHAKPLEGYLFPDTYFFSLSSDAKSIVSTMQSNFYTKIEPLMGEVYASGHSLHDIVVMASLIEKEARTTKSRRMISGILWNRLRLGMPLQVDAVFGYIFNKNTYSPSFADLKVKSPYNTYIHKGLPPTPIDNPGLGSLRDALNPIKTNYLYYITDRKGRMHYSKTYTGHKANLRMYLR